LPVGYAPYFPYAQSEEELKQQARAVPNYNFYHFNSGNGYWGSGSPWSSGPYQNSYYWPTSNTPASASANPLSAQAKTATNKPLNSYFHKPNMEEMDWSEIKAQLQEQKKIWEKKQAEKKLQAKNFAEKARLEKAKAASKPAAKPSVPTVGKASSRGGFGVHGSSGHASAAA